MLMPEINFKAQIAGIVRKKRPISLLDNNLVLSNGEIDSDLLYDAVLFMVDVYETDKKSQMLTNIVRQLQEYA